MKSRDGEGGPVVFTCDVSGETLNTGITDFNDAWAVASGEGWSAYVDPVHGGPWQHYSPEITQRMRDEQEQQDGQEAAQAAPARKKPLIRRIVESLT